MRKNSKLKLDENVVELPGLNGNTYSASRALYNMIKYDKDKVIAKFDDLSEEYGNNVEPTETNAVGGMIILSEDVNALSQSTNKVKDWVKKKYLTLKNKTQYKQKIDKVASQYTLYGWTIGKFLNGRYRGLDGKLYSEDSISIEILGIDTQTLIDIAGDLCAEFEQESVVVKDYTTQRVFYVYNKNRVSKKDIDTKKEKVEEDMDTPTLKEKQKQKAIELLNELDIYKPYINGFKSKATKVCFFENYAGYWANQEPKLQSKINEFEMNNKCLVYAVTHEYTEFGEIWDFLIVPEDEDEWEYLVENEGNYFRVFAYVWNVDDEFSSEFGDIGIRSFGGGIKRVY